MLYLAVLLAALTTPLIVLLAVTVHRSVRTEQAGIEAMASDALFDLHRALDRRLEALATTLRDLAASPVLLDRDSARMRAWARAASLPFPATLALLDADGRDLLTEAAPEGSSSPAAWRPLRVRLDEAAHAPLVTSLVHVSDGRDDVVAVGLAGSSQPGGRHLVALIDPANLSALLDTEGPAAPCTATIVDDSGLVIASRHASRKIGSVVDGTPSTLPAGGWISQTTSHGSRLRTTSARSRTSGWLLLVSFDDDLLWAPVREQLRALLLAGLAMAGPGAAIAWLSIRRLRHAVAIAVAAADQIGDGRSVRPTSTGIAEVDRAVAALAGASTRLASRAEGLRLANQDLEQRVNAYGKQLVSERAFTQLVLGNSADCIKVLDPDGHMISATGSLLREFGADLEDSMRGREWASFWPPCQARLLSTAVAAACEGRTTRLEASRTDVHGRQRWLDILIAPIRNGTDAPEQVLAVSRDITVQHEQANELRLAKEKAEAATLAKSDFLADISHDLRAPLSAIMGYADLMMAERRLGELQQVQVARIKGASTALLRLANDLLDMARIEAGDLALDIRPFALRDLVEDAAATFTPAAEAKGLALEVDVGPAVPPWLLGDPDRLRQVLLNLLGNAVKYTAAGSVSLRVTSDHAGEGVHRIELAIADTGIGIAADDMPRVFRRFSRIEDRAAPPARGAGLGLAIAKSLVERMDGGIEAESTLGVGSRFRMRLNLAAAAAPAATHDAAPGPIRDARILVAEDVSISRAATAALLTSLGCMVDVAASGKEAVQMARATPYALIMMDQDLPGLRGTEAARRIRAFHPDVPIVACSGRGLKTDLEAFRAAGMDEHISKPFDRRDLAALLTRVLVKADTEHAIARSASQDALATLIAPEQKAEAMEAFRRDLAAIETTPTDHARNMVKFVHVVLSTACVLGFLDLAECCQSFEEAVLSGGDVEGTFATLRREAARIVGSG